MPRPTALALASIAGSLAVLTPSAEAQWWLSTMAVQTNQQTQTAFVISAHGSWENLVIGGGFDPQTNSFAGPQRTQSYNWGTGYTDFVFSGSSGIPQYTPAVTPHFGVWLHLVPTNDLRAHWSPANEPLPIVPYSWLYSPINWVQVVIKNPSPTSHIYVGFSGYCLNRGTSIPQMAGQIPPMAELTPLPAFIGVLAPGESRMAEIPAIGSSQLIGFYAQAWWGDAPGPEEQAFVTWMGGPAQPCYPDCNTDGGLTVSDFGCFQTKFVAGDPYADCNGDGILTVADFGCFQTQFVAGCP